MRCKLLETLREQVWKLHLELPKNDLVKWTGGNVSGRDPETGLVVIKPSGVKYPDLRPEHLVVLDVDGKIIEGSLSPSSDTASHLYIYRQRPDVGGIVHTHSNFATAFAAAGRPIPRRWRSALWPKRPTTPPFYLHATRDCPTT